jgi:hypothetical protein
MPPPPGDGTAGAGARTRWSRSWCSGEGVRARRWPVRRSARSTQVEVCVGLSIEAGTRLSLPASLRTICSRPHCWPGCRSSFEVIGDPLPRTHVVCRAWLARRIAEPPWSRTGPHRPGSQPTNRFDLVTPTSTRDAMGVTLQGIPWSGRRLVRQLAARTSTDGRERTVMLARHRRSCWPPTRADDPTPPGGRWPVAPVAIGICSTWLTCVGLTARSSPTLARRGCHLVVAAPRCRARGPRRRWPACSRRVWLGPSPGGGGRCARPRPSGADSVAARRGRSPTGSGAWSRAWIAAGRGRCWPRSRRPWRGRGGASAAGAHGLIASGSEAGGRVGDTEAFILFQHLVDLGVPGVGARRHRPAHGRRRGRRGRRGRAARRPARPAARGRPRRGPAPRGPGGHGRQRDPRRRRPPLLHPARPPRRGGPEDTGSAAEVASLPGRGPRRPTSCRSARTAASPRAWPPGT